MKAFTVLLASILFFTFLSCTLSRRYRTDSAGVTHDPNETFLGLGKGPGKRKIHSLTYPPADLTKGLIDYHKRFNQWPRSLTELTAFSFAAMSAIEKMRKTNFEDLDIVLSTPDTIILSYVYNPALSNDPNSNALLFVDRKFPGKYLYIASGGDFLIENNPQKAHRRRK